MLYSKLLHYAMIEYIFELPRNETFNYNYYAISTLISLF